MSVFKLYSFTHCPKTGLSCQPKISFQPLGHQLLPRGATTGPLSSSLQPCCTGSAEPNPYTGHVPTWPQGGAWCPGLGLTPFPALGWDSFWLPVPILSHTGAPTAPGPTIGCPKSFCTLTHRCIARATSQAKSTTTALRKTWHLRYLVLFWELVISCVQY